MTTRAFNDSAFSRRDYQTIFKTISTTTASRDLQQGVKTGLLEKAGDKRTATYRKRLKVMAWGADWHG